jgi:hypothetical protein
VASTFGLWWVYGMCFVTLNWTVFSVDKMSCLLAISYSL